MIGLIIPAVMRVTIVRRGIEVGITLVIIVALVLETEGLLTQALEILLLKSILRPTVLALEQGDALLCKPLLLFELLPILEQPLLLLVNKLVLTLL